MTDTTHPTLLEQLPAEILINIFASFSLTEIITTFSGLNSYIDSCIHAITNSTHTVTYGNTNAIDLLCLYPTLIARVIITHSPTVDFPSLINLRSLTIKYGTLSQINGTHPEHFPRLEILHICGMNGNSMAEKTKSLDDLFDVILSNGFPQLRVCTVIGFDSLTGNSAWTGSSSLRVLLLDLRTPFDDEQIRSLCPNLRPCKRPSNCSIDLLEAILVANPAGAAKRLRVELRKFKEWNSENKFILDSWSVCGNSDDQKSSGGIVAKILGRIFPSKEPYCYASFVLEITFTREYPFKEPQLKILHPIYHPNISQTCCCSQCCGPDSSHYSPGTSLINMIKRIIDAFDNFNFDNLTDLEYPVEENKNDDTFYEKALKCTLDHGRARFNQ